jgi:hypothetical protein
LWVGLWVKDIAPDPHPEDRLMLPNGRAPLRTTFKWAVHGTACPVTNWPSYELLAIWKRFQMFRAVVLVPGDAMLRCQKRGDHLQQVELGCHLEKRPRVLGRLVHEPHIAGLLPDHLLASMPMRRIRDDCCAHARVAGLIMPPS